MENPLVKRAPVLTLMVWSLQTKRAEKMCPFLQIEGRVFIAPAHYRRDLQRGTNLSSVCAVFSAGIYSVKC